MYGQQNYNQQQQPGPPGYSSSASPAGQWNNGQGNSGQPAGGQWGNQPYQQPAQGNQLQPPQMADADRPLPPGWIRQWNEQYRSWFFVNTLAQPPISQWTHPSVLPPPNGPPPAGYSTPPGPAGQPPTGQDQRGFFGAGGLSQAPAGYPSGGGQQGGYGANPASGYGPAAPVATKNASAPAKKAGMSGLMGAGLGAAGGLALGAFASHEWHEHERREERREEQAYNAGYNQGEYQQHHAGGYSGGYGEEPQESYTTTTHREVHNADGSWYEEDETTEVNDDGW